MPEIGDVARVWRAPPIPGGAGYESDHREEERRYGQRQGNWQVAIPEALEASASQNGTTRPPAGPPHQPSTTLDPEGKGRIIDTWA